ncbi:hypothetical protein AVEN_73100-1 [Araneus ventricosus]|uniref:CCHC-type domain-containing protein n=1 Tax=Araneus ventricosus TaxID=182803 RepID=A0A4Y2IZK4_ARAVE|nr:hypothetical protein AVEN_73100-1 [Araneus ventricosus]
MSPFLVNKLILSTIGEVTVVKKLRSGDLLIQTNSERQATTLGKLTTLGPWPVKVSLHNTLNFSCGVISEQILVQHTEDELVEELNSQGVCAARRIQVRRDGRLIPTKHVILTFETPVLPKFIRSGYLRCSVRPYIPNPLRCFQCQRYGHSHTACREARKIVNDRTPKSGISYSTVVKSQFTNISVNAIQTDESLTKVVCPPLKKLQTFENTLTLTKQISLPKSASHTVLSAPAQTATSISIPSGSVTASSDISLPIKSIPTNKPKNKKDTNT